MENILYYKCLAWCDGDNIYLLLIRDSCDGDDDDRCVCVSICTLCVVFIYPGRLFGDVSS